MLVVRLSESQLLPAAVVVVVVAVQYSAVELWHLPVQVSERQ